LGVSTLSMGWTGPLMFLLLIGFVVIPLAFPYMIFEMTIALLVQNFFHAVCFSLAGKLLGSSMCYLVAKYLLREKIHGSFREMNIYKGIERAMERAPMKFSIILRIINLPLFLKNYGLAIPTNVNFKLYMFSNLVASIPTTAINIQLLGQAGNVRGLFDGSQSASQLAISIGMIVLSVSFLTYVIIYTRRIMKELDNVPETDQVKYVQGLELASSPIDIEPSVQDTNFKVMVEESTTLEV